MSKHSEGAPGKTIVAVFVLGVAVGGVRHVGRRGVGRRAVADPFQESSISDSRFFLSFSRFFLSFFFLCFSANIFINTL